MTDCKQASKLFDDLLTVELASLKDRILQYHSTTCLDAEGSHVKSFAEPLAEVSQASALSRTPALIRHDLVASELELWPFWYASALNAIGRQSVVVMAVAESVALVVKPHRASTSRACRCLIHPYSGLRFIWDLIAASLLLLELVLIPLNMISQLPKELFIFDVTSVVYWTIDMVFSFLTGFDVGGIVEMRLRPIVRNYIYRWFFSDLLLLVSDWFYIYLEFETFRSVSVVRFARLVPFFRLIRLLRLVRTTSVLKKIVDGTQSSVLINITNISKFALIIMLMNHWIACAYCVMARTIEQLEHTSTNNWFAVYTDHALTDVSRYLVALHWSIVQFSSPFHGPSNEGPDRVYAIFTNLCGLISISLFVGRLASEFEQMQAVVQDRLNDEAKLRKYFSENFVSTELAIRINRFLRKNHECHVKRVSPKDIFFFENLPLSLRMELHREVYLPVISFHPLFRRFDAEDLVGSMMLSHMALLERNCFGGEEVLAKGVQVSDMLFVISGEFEHSASNEVTSQIARRGLWLCEACLFVKWYCRGHLVASRPSDLLCLNVNKFHAISKLHCFQQVRQYAFLFVDHVLSRNYFNDLSDAELIADLVEIAFASPETRVVQMSSELSSESAFTDFTV